MSRLVPSLPETYLHGLRSMKSMGAVVLTLSLTHQLSEEGYYWYNLPKSAGYPFLALVEHTNYLSPEHFGGDHILYMGDYLEPEHEYLPALPGRAAGALPAGADQVQPQVRARLGQEVLALPHRLRPARAAGEPFKKYPRHPDPHPRPLLRLHEPGLSLGPRHQFRRRDRPAGSPVDDGAGEVKTACDESPKNLRRSCSPALLRILSFSPQA